VRERPIERYNEDRPIPAAMRRKASASPKKKSSADVSVAATPAYEDKQTHTTRLLRSSTVERERRGSTTKRRIKVDHYTALGKLPEQMEGLHAANDETTPSKRRRRK